MKLSMSYLMMSGLLLTVAAIADHETEIPIVGNGEAKRAPEYAQVQVYVESTCYNTSVAAKNANAKLANAVITLLNEKGYPRSEKDIDPRPGSNIRQSEPSDETDAQGRIKYRCLKKWRATNTITVKTAKLDKLPDLQDEVLALIDKATTHEGETQTVGQLGSFSFDVNPATRATMSREATKAAVADARTQLDELAEGNLCPFKSVRVASISPTQRTTPTFRARSLEGMADISGGGSPTPIRPGDVLEVASVSVVFMVETDRFCLPTKK